MLIQIFLLKDVKVTEISEITKQTTLGGCPALAITGDANTLFIE